MKIEASKLAKHIQKFSINGLMNTALLNFGDLGMTTKVQSAMICMTDSLLEKKAFQEYEAISEVGIKNVSMLIKTLTRYSDNLVKICKEENFLKIIAESGSTNLTLCDKEFVDNNFDAKMPEGFDEGFKLNVDKLDSIKSAAEMLSSNSVDLEVKNNSLTLNTKNENGDLITETCAVTYKDAKCSFGEYLLNLIKVIEGEVIVSFNTDYPIRISEKTSQGFVNYIVAPKIDNE